MQAKPNLPHDSTVTPTFIAGLKSTGPMSLDTGLLMIKSYPLVHFLFVKVFGEYLWLLLNTSSFKPFPELGCLLMASEVRRSFV